SIATTEIQTAAKERPSSVLLADFRRQLRSAVVIPFRTLVSRTAVRVIGGLARAHRCWTARDPEPARCSIRLRFERPEANSGICAIFGTPPALAGQQYGPRTRYLLCSPVLRPPEATQVPCSCRRTLSTDPTHATKSLPESPRS